MQREGVLWLAANGHCGKATLAYDSFKSVRDHAAQASGILNDLHSLCPTASQEP